MGDIPEEHLVPFWINIFNCLSIHSCIVSGPPTENVRSQNKFFSHHQYNIQRVPWSLVDIYHGVLRGNRPIGKTKAIFSDSDKRILHTCSTIDPRIHFLVNFQAQSCNAISVLTSDDANKEMDLAVGKYLKEIIILDENTGSVCKYYNVKLIIILIIFLL